MSKNLCERPLTPLVIKDRGEKLLIVHTSSPRLLVQSCGAAGAAVMGGVSVRPRNVEVDYQIGVMEAIRKTRHRLDAEERQMSLFHTPTSSCGGGRETSVPDTRHRPPPEG